MSFVFLKNILFPRPLGLEQARASSNPPGQNAETSGMAKHYKGKNRLVVAANGSTDLESEKPPSLHSNSTTLDLESGQCNSCKPRINGEAPQEKDSRFKPSARMISDAIIGLSDGLTVPFALTAGLSSLGNARLVVLGGLAELIAGAISMGLGGFIGAKSEAYEISFTNMMHQLTTQSENHTKLQSHQPKNSSKHHPAKPRKWYTRASNLMDFQP